MPGSKLKAKISQPLDSESTKENYDLIMAEVENEYNDLLLS